jgi:hypothetical protein
MNNMNNSQQLLINPVNITNGSINGITQRFGYNHHNSSCLFKEKKNSSEKSNPCYHLKNNTDLFNYCNNLVHPMVHFPNDNLTLKQYLNIQIENVNKDSNNGDNLVGKHTKLLQTGYYNNYIHDYYYYRYHNYWVDVVFWSMIGLIMSIFLITCCFLSNGYYIYP